MRPTVLMPVRNGKVFRQIFLGGGGQGNPRKNADLPRRGTSVNILVSIRIELGVLNIID